MENSIGKKDTIQKGQRDWGKTNPRQPKLESLSRISALLKYIWGSAFFGAKSTLSLEINGSLTHFLAARSGRPMHFGEKIKPKPCFSLCSSGCPFLKSRNLAIISPKKTNTDLEWRLKYFQSAPIYYKCWTLWPSIGPKAQKGNHGISEANLQPLGPMFLH